MEHLKVIARLVGHTVEKIALNTSHKWLLDHLLNVPPVHDLSSDSSLAFHAEAVGLTHDWSNLYSSHSKTRGLGTNGSNKVDLLQLGARRAQKHTGDLNNVSLLKLGQDSLDLVVLGWKDVKGQGRHPEGGWNEVGLVDSLDDSGQIWESPGISLVLDKSRDSQGLANLLLNRDDWTGQDGLD